MDDNPYISLVFPEILLFTCLCSFNTTVTIKNGSRMDITEVGYKGICTKYSQKAIGLRVISFNSHNIPG